MFTLDDPPVTPPPSSTALRELATGKFDALFSRTTFRVSDLYRQAQHPPPPPTVELVSSQPNAPLSYVLPTYPPLARLAQVSGPVRFTAQVDAQGHLTDLKIVEGHPLLKQSVESAVSGWIYPVAGSSTQVTAIVEFRNQCTAQEQQ